MPNVSDTVGLVGRLRERPVVVYSKRASKRQREWLQNYYDQTGFDALYQHEFDQRAVTFAKLMSDNFEWYESHANATKRAIEKYPVSRKKTQP